MSNVWEFLGLPANHRAENKVVQLVKHYADVAHKVTFPCLGQIKKDGVFAMIVIDNTNWQEKTGIFGRTGKQLTSCEQLLPTFKKSTPGCLNMRCAIIAELCCDLCSLEELSGIVNPNRKKPLSSEQERYAAAMYFAVHDMVYLSELIEGRSERPYGLRISDLVRHLGVLDYKGHRILNVQLDNEEQAAEFAERCIAAKEEGMVGKDPNAGWIAGRKNEVAWKLVKGVDYHLEVLGVEEGKGKRAGMVANLLVRWRPYGDPKADWVLLPVDLAGHKDEQRREWWNDPSIIGGKIVHVHALCIGSKGALRLPKAKEVRIDKTEADL